MPTLGRVRHAGETTIVELDGDADLAALPELAQLLARAVATASGSVVVDLDGLALLDDAALGIIVGAAATARRRGHRFRLVCTDDARRARLAETCLDQIIDVADTAIGPDHADMPTTETSEPESSTTATSTSDVSTSGTYTAVIFSSRRTEIDDVGYAVMTDEMEQLARTQPGFRGIESVRAADGTGITVSYWADHAAAHHWKHVTDHLAAQQLGRERWYDHYRVRIATVEREYGFARPIYHLATPADWAEAGRTGTYPMSTRGITFADEGFVHCSFDHQMTGVANRFYGDVDELMVLHLDRAALDGRLVLEPAADGVDELFPHLYDPITTDAVTTTTVWRRDGDVWRDPPVSTDRSTG